MTASRTAVACSAALAGLAVGGCGSGDRSDGANDGGGGAPVVLLEPACGSSWKPSGCRVVSSDDPVLASRATWRNLHGDALNTDEVSIVVAPRFSSGWTTEQATFNVTGPVFDSRGNLYFAPLLPKEDVSLISLEPEGGARRFALPGTGARVGGGTPMVLRNPDDEGEELVYLGLYDRAFAVRTDGEVVWDKSTGLTNPDKPSVFGLNYHPQSDAIVGIARDGFVYALDRKTGDPVATFELPGEASPAGSGLPAELVAAVTPLFEQFVQRVPGVSGADLVDVLLGNGTEVANFFSIDPHTGRIWIAATAPDADDGTTDGVSELGALYALDIVDGGGTRAFTEICRRTFQGGSASTPSLRADGDRVYVGDNFGKLIAIDNQCELLWEVDVGGQIVGSIGVSSDNAELFAATQTSIIKVFDRDTSGEIAWSVQPDVLDPTGMEISFNLNLVSIGANGLGFQAGAGVELTRPLPTRVGVGLLDRETGGILHFTEGLDETVAVMSVGPEGGTYLGNSPVRRLFSLALGLETPPPVGGITHYEPERLDLLVRDAACAGARRAANAAENESVCPDSTNADVEQIRELVAQARGAAATGESTGDITAAERAEIDAGLDSAGDALDDGNLADAANALAEISLLLDR